MTDDVRIAVLIPCYNEEMTIANVVSDFRTAIPNARIYVYDNNSTDQSVERAQEAGAIVRSENLQGKGNVIRRMFADIDSDVYVLVDGDDTYDAARAPDLVERLLEQQLDMVNAARGFSSDLVAGRLFADSGLPSLAALSARKQPKPFGASPSDQGQEEMPCPVQT